MIFYNNGLKMIELFRNMLLTEVCSSISCVWSICEACPESIQPLWISQEPFAWPWCNLATSQRRPLSASVNSYSPVGLVIRQWDAVGWVCVLLDHRIYKRRF